MRVLVDVSAGEAVTDALRQAGHDTVSVRDRDPRLSDSEILAWAVAENRLVVTMDKDFGELVYHSGHAHSGVLLLRLADAAAVEKARIAAMILGQFGGQLLGHFGVYQDGRLRIR